ncbi:MAG: response regulator transcription factor [Chloroflexi bacterium]|nr:response regulator transcription factor [Chloroflexota bacterium]MBI2983804.1 response regulator transcription factor [Chloroflexota bacterium]
MAGPRPLILIVEDDSDLGLSIVEYLKEEGLEAKLARDGDQAMRMVDSLSPAAVVLDLMMPRRDGFSVLRELRSDGRIASLPVIVVTAIFGLSERLYATELGAADYITKPFKLEDLLARIVALLPAGQRPPGVAGQRRPEAPRRGGSP